MNILTRRSRNQNKVNHKEQKEEILIVAKNAELLNNKGLLQLKLHNGEGYTYDDKTFKHMKFKTLMINDTMEKNAHTYSGILGYWESYKEESFKQKAQVSVSLGFKGLGLSQNLLDYLESKEIFTPTEVQQMELYTPVTKKDGFISGSFWALLLIMLQQ